MLVEPLNGAGRREGGGAERHPFDPCAGTARGALSANTERAMRSDLAIYAAWCEACGEGALPASAETIAAFVDAMAKVRAPATVRRYVASIAAAHRARGWEKTARSEPVRRALQRMHRRKGRRQAQARGLTGPLRERLLDAGGDGLIDARNRALLAVAYDTLLRRAELVSLQVADIVVEPDGAATVLVRRAKCDREGRGAMAYVAPDSVALVHEWLERSGVADGRLFRSLNRGALGERLDASHANGRGGLCARARYTCDERPRTVPCRASVQCAARAAPVLCGARRRTRRAATRSVRSGWLASECLARVECVAAGPVPCVPATAKPQMRCLFFLNIAPVPVRSRRRVRSTDRSECQWQPKTAHFWQLKTAQSGGSIPAAPEPRRPPTHRPRAPLRTPGCMAYAETAR